MPCVNFGVITSSPSMIMAGSTTAAAGSTMAAGSTTPAVACWMPDGPGSGEELKTAEEDMTSPLWPPKSTNVFANLRSLPPIARVAVSAFRLA